MKKFIQVFNSLIGIVAIAFLFSQFASATVKVFNHDLVQINKKAEVTLSSNDINQGEVLGTTTDVALAATTPVPCADCGITPPPTSYTLLVSKTGSGTGVVVDNFGGINCGSACSATYTPSLQVILTAKPATGSTFAGWGGACADTVSTCTVTMSTNKTATATFITASPIIQSVSAGDITTIEVGLDIMVLPNNSPTTVWFRYSTSNPGSCNDSFGTKFPPSGVEIGSGMTPTGFTQYITGLTPATTYYYCAVAENSAGKSFSSVKTFTTSTGNPILTTLAATEITSTIAKLRGTVNLNGMSYITANARFYYRKTSDTSTPINCLNVAQYGTGVAGTSVPIQNLTLTNLWGDQTVETVVGDGNDVSIANLSPGTNYSYCIVVYDNIMAPNWNYDDEVKSFTTTGGTTSYTLTVNKTGTGSGTITSYPAGINCGADSNSCSAIFTAGSQITLTPSIVGATSTFTGWSNNCVPLNSLTSVCTVSMNNNQVVTANFSSVTPASYTVMVAFPSSNPGGSGSVVSNPSGINCGKAAGSCSVDFVLGTTITLTAIPEPGYKFMQWSMAYNGVTGVCGGDTNPICTFTMNFSQPYYAYPIFGASTGSVATYKITADPITSRISGGSNTIVSVFSLTNLSNESARLSAIKLTRGGNITGHIAVTDHAKIYDYTSGSLGSLLGTGGDWSGTAAGSTVTVTLDTPFTIATGTTAKIAVTVNTASATANDTLQISLNGASDINLRSAITNTALNPDPIITWPVFGPIIVFGSSPPLLTVSKVGTGTGVVVDNLGGINCGSICSATYTPGLQVTLTAKPATGSTFTGWSGNGGCGSETNTTCQVIMDGYRDVKATFSLSTNSASLSIVTSNNLPVGDGTVVSSPAGINCVVTGGIATGTCKSSFKIGENIVLTAVSGSNSTFSGWGGCFSNTKTCSFIINKDIGVTATFHVGTNGPTLKIIYPEGDEVLPVGSKQIIKWSRSGDYPQSFRQYIQLINMDNPTIGNAVYFTDNIAENEFNWDIYLSVILSLSPNNAYSTGKYIIMISTFIPPETISGTSSPLAWTYSDPFSIVAPSTIGTIKAPTAGNYAFKMKWYRSVAASYMFNAKNMIDLVEPASAGTTSIKTSVALDPNKNYVIFNPDLNHVEKLDVDTSSDSTSVKLKTPLGGNYTVSSKTKIASLLGIYWGWCPTVIGPVDLGYYNAGEEILIGEVTNYYNDVLEPLYSNNSEFFFLEQGTDGKYQAVIDEGKHLGGWKGVGVKEGYDDGGFEVYQVPTAITNIAVPLPVAGTNQTPYCGFGTSTSSQPIVPTITTVPITPTTSTATPTVTTTPVTSAEVLLQERIQKLEYQVSELERQLVETEKKLVQQIDEQLTKSVAGKMLLQVESNGEAWYVDKDTQKKFYLKDGNTAYTALQAFGLGISNENLAKIPVTTSEQVVAKDSDGDGLDDQFETAIGTDPMNKDTDNDGYTDSVEVTNGYSPLGLGKTAIDANLVKSLEGRIILAVNKHGEAFYISNGIAYYLKDGLSAYQIMRNQSLGITNDNIRKIPVGTLEKTE